MSIECHMLPFGRIEKFLTFLTAAVAATATLVAHDTTNETIFRTPRLSQFFSGILPKGNEIASNHHHRKHICLTFVNGNNSSFHTFICRFVLTIPRHSLHFIILLRCVSRLVWCGCVACRVCLTDWPTDWLSESRERECVCSVLESVTMRGRSERYGKPRRNNV